MRSRLLLTAMGVLLVSCGDADPVPPLAARAAASALAPSPAPASIGASTACDSPRGRVLEVGTGSALPVPSAAAKVARDGDVIRIRAGDYRGDVALWTASDLKICGWGGRVRLFADGRNEGGKGIWVISGRNVTVDGIDFHGARVPDRNGAGIRAEHSGQLAVLNSGFYDNENGILGAHRSDATVLIEGSEFARNGHGDGQSHGIYIGRAASLIVLRSFFHGARIGHNLKSRARENRIENSYFMDGPTGTSSYLADFPDGGMTYLRGNLFHKGPEADNGTAIAFGAEGIAWPVNTVEMVHNTIVMTRKGGAYLAAPGNTQSVRMTANLFAGIGTPSLVRRGFKPHKVVQLNNVHLSAHDIPGADSIDSPDFWPAAAVRGQMGLPGIADPDYRNDSPRPYSRRALASGARFAGALQAEP